MARSSRTTRSSRRAPRRSARHGAIAADAAIAASPEAVYAFLADLGNHGLLAPRLVEVLVLERSLPDAPQRAAVRLRGPLAIRRLASTEMTCARSRGTISGRALLGRRTQASVTWEIARSDIGARVALRAVVDTAGPIDRLLLGLGGRYWLRRRFFAALDALAARLEPAAGPARIERGGARRLSPLPARAPS